MSSPDTRPRWSGSSRSEASTSGSAGAALRRAAEGSEGGRDFASRDRLVHAVGTAGVEHGWITRVHSQPDHSQLVEPGVHREPMVAGIKALEDSPAFAP